MTTLMATPPRHIGPARTIRHGLTLAGRSIGKIRKNPEVLIDVTLQPILFLVLFVYVFGGTLGAGLPGVNATGGGRRSDYLVFITPGILFMTVASVALGTAISTATDMTTGIIARFRTMNIARVSVLTGHVLGAVIKTAAAVVIVAAFAFAIGFRSDAGPLGWLGVVGLVILIAFSLTWLTVGMGLAADSVETASNTPLFLMILPFVSSAFVPTDAMPAGLRQFAEHQPFTPMIETTRGLLGGEPDGSTALLAVGWCVAIALAGYVWARSLDRRDPSS